MKFIRKLFGHKFHQDSAFYQVYKWCERCSYKKALALLVGVSLVILPHSVFAAIAFGGANASMTTCPSSTTCTVAITTSGSNRYLVVYVQDPTHIVTGVKYAGVAMTSISSVSTSAGSEFVELWGLANPTTGANNYVLTSSSAQQPLTGASYYTGVNQVTSSPDSAGSNTGTSQSSPFVTSTIVVASNSWTVLGMRSQALSTSAGTGSTFRSSDTGVDGRNVGLYDSNGTVNTGSHSMSVTFTGTQTIAAAMVSLCDTACSAPSTAVSIPQDIINFDE